MATPADKIATEGPTFKDKVANFFGFGGTYKAADATARKAEDKSGDSKGEKVRSGKVPSATSDSAPVLGMRKEGSKPGRSTDSVEGGKKVKKEKREIKSRLRLFEERGPGVLSTDSSLGELSPLFVPAPEPTDREEDPWFSVDFATSVRSSYGL